MAKFTDGAGREWVLVIDVPAIEAVAAATEVRVDRLIRDQMAGLAELLDDPVRFARVLWVLCEERAEKIPVTPEQFGRALYGDPLEEAGKAFVGALADFSPSRPRRLLRELVKKNEEMQEADTARALEAIAAIGSTPSDSATNSPASSASTPAPEG